MKQLITLEGTIEQIIFTNEENGYTVCELSCSDENIVAVGYMPFVKEGEIIKVTGKWSVHPEYGEQLKIDSYEKIMPQTRDAILKYLSSGVIKGIGPSTASRIVEKFGEETFEVIKNNPEKLSGIKGISLERALKIGNEFREQNELREVVMFLQKFGISPNFAAKIYKVFGSDTIKSIMQNPYRLADEIDGIGFKKADKIASSLGIDPASEFRVASAVRYLLMEAAASGHTFLPEDILKNGLSKLLGIDEEPISHGIMRMIFDDKIRIENNREEGRRIYLTPFLIAEQNVARKISELCSVKIQPDMNKFDKKLRNIQIEEGIIFADMQREAIYQALCNGVAIITGGPGTGKTTIIKAIISLYRNDGFKIGLAAPTGRAAERMSLATGFEAKTIHRLLEYGYEDYEDTRENVPFKRHEGNPLDVDILIVDEFSMVDILLMNHLLKALKPSTRLILVGDADQLPSVGPGNVLKDLIKSGMIKVVCLKEIFRQAAQSLIVLNAHRINKGEMPDLKCKDKDFFYIRRETPHGIISTIVDLCMRRLPSYYGYDPVRDMQIIAPSRKGAVGILNLNIELQKALNPHNSVKSEKQMRDYVFREGDKVMQIKNNYDLIWSRKNDDISGRGIFNGQCGVIEAIDHEQQLIKVVFDEDKIAEYDFSILDELEMAYAMTVHKSQGSEFPAVIIPAYPCSHFLMTRNLLYTAVTRAKELVVIVGMEEVIAHMVGNDRVALRYSGLAEKLSAWERWQDERKYIKKD